MKILKKLGNEIDNLYNKYYLNRYKSFIRKLNLKERKGYVFSLIYSLFSFMNLLLIKIISQKMKISFFSLITVTGSLIIFLCIYRILIATKSFESPKKNIDMKFISKGGIFSFISFMTFVGSVYYSSSITNISLIIRFFPFLFLFSESINNENEKDISKQEIICFLVSLVSFILIFLTNVAIGDYIGILLGFLSIISKVLGSYYWKKNKSSFLDLYLLAFGFLCSSIGGIFMVHLNDKMENFTIGNWIVVILFAMSIYYAKIFLFKLLKYVSNADKIIMFNLLIIIFCLFADFLIFKTKFNWTFVFILFILVNSFFFSKDLIKSHYKNE